MLLKIFYDFVITDEINISSFRHKLVLDQMTTKKVVKVVSFGLSPIGEKYPQTKEKPTRECATECDIPRGTYPVTYHTVICH